MRNPFKSKEDEEKFFGGLKEGYAYYLTSTTLEQRAKGDEIFEKWVESFRPSLQKRAFSLVNDERE